MLSHHLLSIKFNFDKCFWAFLLTQEVSYGRRGDSRSVPVVAAVKVTKGRCRVYINQHYRTGQGGGLRVGKDDSFCSIMFFM